MINVKYLEKIAEQSFSEKSWRAWTGLQGNDPIAHASEALATGLLAKGAYNIGKNFQHISDSSWKRKPTRRYTLPAMAVMVYGNYRDSQ